MRALWKAIDFDDSDTKKLTRYTILDVPWYKYIISEIICWICDAFHQALSIPFPSDMYVWNFYDNEWALANDYYGDVPTLFHLYICAPIFRWAYNGITHEKTFEVFIDSDTKRRK